ncbi:hypothetical protein KVR01_005688 [Diaporthe batatas]|uniref:uncharacterized protein n=1 Tax=Diaporthe batatas TaxID=748121 RepID=UPI001D035E6E|nr:uncharacterized protein KVR01_005688 [Diaporthe batatas]KAG8165413.1 hypothetical protein KVR01_005688 [Diaporthe batatas]
MWPAADRLLFTSGRSLRLTMPLELPDPLPANLGEYARVLYRRHFAHEFALGTVKPLIIPQSVLVTFGLPILYFTIPHRNRPWLFRARYLLMLFIVLYNARESFVTTSPNFAMGYAVGLMQAWGIIWNMTLLVFMKPQFDAERVEKRRARPSANGHAARVNGSSNGDARASGADDNVRPVQNSSNGHVVTGVNGNSKAPPAQTQESLHAGHTIADHVPDEDVARSLAEGYEYYWQSYPEQDPWLTRLDWSFDLVTSFRGTGWNWFIPVAPHFSKPERPQSGSPVDLASIPESTPHGYRRYTTRRAWLRAEVGSFAIGYLALDALSVLMMKDPYFILGPEYTRSAVPVPVPLPGLLAALPPWLLFTYRCLVSFSGVLAAISMVMKLWQLICAFALRPLLGTRAELWHYPTLMGGFTHNVLDRGLAGYWGAWWHQTFRVAFGAPAAWMASPAGDGRRRQVSKTLAGLFAFAQSGFLHALGSASCLPPSRPWAPPVFFMLSWVGILLQSAACGAMRRAGITPRLPTWATRAGNFVFVSLWLGSTQYWMLDDIARSGIWLLEPVPASLFRALGLGEPGDHWLRWTWDELPRLHAGQHWWDGGVAL